MSTLDQELIDQVNAMAQRSGSSLVVQGGMTNPREIQQAAARLINAHEFEARLIECRLLSSEVEGIAGVRWDRDDWMLILSESWPGGGHSLHVHLAPTHRRAELIERLEEALPRRAWVGDVAEQILGDTPAIRRTKEQIRRVSRFKDISVLVLGETGTGKELVAEAIHQLASGDREPFVAINCSAIPADLFESELFGHEAGAYTGARGARTGLLEAAGFGTVFLDEIGEMPASLQPKLLRALETREFRRVGSNTSLPLRARVISATNRGVSGDTDSRLRLDLQFRLAGFTIVLPPLRERMSDVDLLARHFIELFAERQGIKNCRITDEALARLHAYDWPGNVRELRSTLDRAAILSAGATIEAPAIEAAMTQLRGQSFGGVGALERGTLPLSGAPFSLPESEHLREKLGPQSSLRDIERDLVLSAFHETGQNVSKTARLLGLPRTTLRSKLRRYGVTK